MPRAHPIQDGDTAFTGVNNRLDPAQLPPGFVADAENIRFNSGIAEPRHAVRKVMFANLKNTADTPSAYTTTIGGVDVTSGTQNIDQGLLNYDTIRGFGKFQDPTGFSWLLVATATKTYAIREGMDVVEVQKSGGSVANSTDVTFVQCFDTVVMFRGSGSAPLALTDVTTGWTDITQTANSTDFSENPSDGTEAIPNADNGLFFQNRLLIPHSRDLVAASDYLNYTRYQPVLSSFRINQGSEDALVALWKYDETTVLCFKESSVYAVRNIYGDLSDIFLDEITREYGLISAKAVTTVGKDVWFLSDQRGVVSLHLSESGKMQGADIPVSEPVQGYIDRINWDYANKAAAIYHRNKYYLAVPLDSNTSNSAILVYDFRNQAWSGIDTGAQITGLHSFATYKYRGAKRLFFATSADQSYVNLYDDSHLSGTEDESVDHTDTTGRNISGTPVATSITTRGYTGGVAARKRFRAAGIGVQTNGVVGSSVGLDLTASQDGFKEDTTLLTDKNFSRTSYTRPFDKADYVETNTNDDHLTPYREDYSVELAGANTIDPGTNGMDPDALQESTHFVAFSREGRHCQLKLTNDEGRCLLTETSVGATPTDSSHYDKR